MTQPPPVNEHPAADSSTGRPPTGDARTLTGREVGTLMLIWTAAVGGWFAILVVDGSIRPAALVLAVGGLFALIWLLGMLILGLFLAGGD